jgi:ATP-dependent protease ClpP protease subunit
MLAPSPEFVLPAGRPRPEIPPCLPSWFSVQRHDGLALVSIQDEIGTFNNTANDLLAAIGDAQEIEFIINSNGGDGVTAFKIHDALAGKVKLATIHGNCASAAWIFALTADRILIASTAHVLIHTVVDAVVGTSDELEMAARRLRKLNARLRKLFAVRTKQPSRVIDKLFDGLDHELPAEECLQLGLVDELFTPTVPKSKHASFRIQQAAAGLAPTEDEKLFKTFLAAFGTVTVRDCAAFRREVSEWIAVKVKPL